MTEEEAEFVGWLIKEKDVQQEVVVLSSRETITPQGDKVWSSEVL